MNGLFYSSVFTLTLCYSYIYISPGLHSGMRSVPGLSPVLDEGLGIELGPGLGSGPGLGILLYTGPHPGLGYD